MIDQILRSIQEIFDENSSSRQKKNIPGMWENFKVYVLFETLLIKEDKIYVLVIGLENVDGVSIDQEIFSGNRRSFRSFLDSSAIEEKINNHLTYLMNRFEQE